MVHLIQDKALKQAEQSLKKHNIPTRAQSSDKMAKRPLTSLSTKGGKYESGLTFTRPISGISEINQNASKYKT